MTKTTRGETRLHLRLSNDEHEMCSKVAQALGLKLSSAVRAVMWEKYHLLGLNGTRAVLPMHEVVTKAVGNQTNDAGTHHQYGEMRVPPIYPAEESAAPDQTSDELEDLTNGLLR